jgi:ADP-ribosylglycohydrolase
VEGGDGLESRFGLMMGGLDEQLYGAIFGLVVADAVGVPVEFKTRISLERNPVIDMRGYGTHNQPPGTWSDDSSLTLCLLDSLCNGFDPDDVMARFRSWLHEGRYSSGGSVFDIGNATRQAIHRSESGIRAVDCGGRLESDNGNGSLMRILPVAFYIASLHPTQMQPTNEMMDLIHQASSITHGHARSLIACGMYISIALRLIHEASIPEAIQQGIRDAESYYGLRQEYSYDLSAFRRLTTGVLMSVKPSEVKSTGYVVDTLEAAVWCLLHTSSYQECVLKAVNLGDDTDTVAAVAGGLAGMYYGYDAIPDDWLRHLIKRKEIETICNRAIEGYVANAVDRMRIHFPLLEEIASNEAYRKWCQAHSAYVEDAPCGTLPERISALTYAFYDSRVGVPDYSGTLCDYDWSEVEAEQLPTQKLCASDLLLTRAILTWHFRRDHFLEGSLISESIAEGKLLQLFRHMFLLQSGVKRTIISHSYNLPNKQDSMEFR